MKKSLFKSKKAYKLTVISACVLACTIAIPSIIVPSYLSYKKYYDDLMAEREHQKYLDSLPLKFEGISASVVDGTLFYNNGRAQPIGSDFDVIAHFSEKGKEFTTKLNSNEFSVNAPADFANNGGKVTISYTYTYEDENKEDDIAPVSETKTTEVYLSLTDVELTRLLVNSRPYKIYYCEGEKFEKDGITATAIYNDGTKIELESKDLKIETTTGLATTNKVATISYSDGKGSVNADVPITVDSKADFNNGYVLSIEQDGDITLNEGQMLSEAIPSIRATYESGNRLLLSNDAYTVDGNLEEASVLKNCILSVRLKADLDITCNVAVRVRKALEAENAVITGGSTKEVKGYKIINDSYVEIGNTTVVEKASKLIFNLSSDKVSRTNLSIKLANRTLNSEGNKIEAIKLNEILSIKVNNHFFPINDNATLSTHGNSGEDANKYVIEEFNLPNIVLNKGQNKIEFDLNYASKVTNQTKNIAIDSLNFSSIYEGKIYQSLNDALTSNDDLSDSIMVEKVKDWHTISGVGAYCHAMVSDGDYLYSTYTSYSENLRGIGVIKTDSTTGEIVATSKKTDALFTEASAGITLYDDKVIIFKNDGGRMYVNKSEFIDGCEFKDYDGFNFEGLEGTRLKDVVYNERLEQFIVFYGSGSAKIFDKDFKEVKKINVPSDSLGDASRMTAGDDYIYFSYTRNGTYTPVVRIFDWEGNYISRAVIPNTLDIMGSVVTNSQNTNVQGLAYINGSLYFSILKFSAANGGDQSAHIKASLSVIKEDRELELNVGEYITACNDYYGQKAELSINPVTGTTGVIGESSQWAMGGVSDGEYIYLSSNPKTNDNGHVYKVDPSTYQVIAKSATYRTNIAGDNSRLFIKDGNLYTVVGENKVLHTPLNSFEEGTKFVAAEDLPFEKVIGKLEEKENIKAVQWNEYTSQYAVADNLNNLYLLDETGVIQSEINLVGEEGHIVSSIASDSRFIYVSYKVNNQPQLPLEIYTWDGQYVGNHGTDFSLDFNYNIQSVFVHNDVLHMVVCSWEQGKENIMLFNVKNNVSVFDKDVLTGIEIESMPDKLTYYAGEGFDTTGMVVNAIYNQGTLKKPITNYTIEPRILNNIGTYNVAISYQEGSIKYTQNVEVTVKEPLNFGEYVTSTDNPIFKVNAANENYGHLFSGGYSMGGVSDGKYMYLAQNMAGNNSTRIVKVDPANNYEVIATSKTFDTLVASGKTQDNSRLFIKGDTLYCVLADNNIVSVKLSEFADECTLTLDNSLPFGNIPTNTNASGNLEEYTDAEFNEEKNKFAVLRGHHLYLLSEDGTLLNTIIPNNNDNAGISEQNPASVSSDDKYIYVSHKKDNQKSVLIRIYDWDGNFIKACAPEGIQLAKDGYNTQCIFFHNGIAYAALCTWANTGGYYLWSISFGE